MARTQISSDPYARTTLYREKATDGECAYCGHKGRLWIYYTRSDDNIRVHRGPVNAKAVCGVNCHRAYIGE